VTVSTSPRDSIRWISGSRIAAGTKSSPVSRSSRRPPARRQLRAPADGPDVKEEPRGTEKGRTVVKKRADYGSKADTWFDSLDDDLAPLAAELRALILQAVPGATEVIKWGAPVYEKENVSICGLRAARAHVSLQFGSIGTSLDDPDGLLEGTGKSMRHVKVRMRGEIKKRRFSSWIRRAAKACSSA